MVGTYTAKQIRLAGRIYDALMGYEDVIMFSMENGKHPNDGHIVQLIADTIAKERGF